MFTLNNPMETDEQKLKDLEYKVLVFGRETGESGTPHLQGFITFNRSYRFAAVKRLLGERAHIEPAKAADAQNYCLKDGDYFKDDRRQQGARTDLRAVASAIKAGATLDKLLEDYPVECLKYPSGISFARSRSYKPRDRNEPPEVIWIYGPTGVGKTRYVFDREPDLWVSGKNLRWWDGYEQQAAVLIDDFRKDFCTFHELLRILDRYPYRADMKYGHMQLNSRRIYITSCYSPDRVYETREDIGQLTRRITETINMN